jgi:hypothetical protein
VLCNIINLIYKKKVSYELKHTILTEENVQVRMLKIIKDKNKYKAQAFLKKTTFFKIVKFLVIVYSQIRWLF